MKKIIKAILIAIIFTILLPTVFSLNQTNTNETTNETIIINITINQTEINNTNTTEINDTEINQTNINNTNTNNANTNQTENFCNISISFEFEKDLFLSGEKISYYNVLNSNESIDYISFNITYWIEDLWGNIVKNPYTTTNTYKKSWTPNIDEIDRIFIFKNKLETNCTNLNNQTESNYTIKVMKEFIDDNQTIINDTNYSEINSTNITITDINTTNTTEINETNEENTNETNEEQETEEENTEETEEETTLTGIHYAILEFKEQIEQEETFETKIWIANYDETSISFQIWSYAYRSSKCISDSGEREANLVEKTILPGENKSISLSNTINPDIEPGSYYLKIKLLKEGLVNPYELKESIEIIEKQEITNTNNSTTNTTTSKNNLTIENIEINTTNKTIEDKSVDDKNLFNNIISKFFSDEKSENEKSNSESNATSIYKSKNEKIKDYLIYAVAGIFLVGIIVIIWKKGV